MSDLHQNLESTLNRKFPPASLPEVEYAYPLKESNKYFHLSQLRRNYVLADNGIIYDLKSGLSCGVWEIGGNNIFVVDFQLGDNNKMRLESRGAGANDAERELIALTFTIERGMIQTKVGYLYPWAREQVYTRTAETALRLRHGKSISISDKNHAPKFMVSSRGMSV
jgi:hypothetical protein